MDTIGSLIDKLSIINLKIWYREEIKHSSPDDHEVAKVAREIGVLNQQRHLLIEEIDRSLEELQQGLKIYKSWPQLKNYESNFQKFP